MGRGIGMPEGTGESPAVRARARTHTRKTRAHTD